MKTYSARPGQERTRMVPCPLCGGEKFRSFLASPQVDYQRCRSCGLVLQNPQPVQEDLLLRYDNDYFDYETANEEAFFQLMLKGLADLRFGSREEDLKKRGRFLDVGCATGRLLYHFSQRGWDVEGVEVCEGSARVARERGGFPVYTRPLETLGLPGESFSVIHASHLIEHLNDPVAFCREIHRVLVPGGMVYLTTPNVGGFQFRLFRGRWRSAIADHTFLFDRKTIKTLLTHQDFVITGHKTWGGLARGAGPLWLKKVLDRWAKPLGFGDVMIFGAQKNRGDLRS